MKFNKKALKLTATVAGAVALGTVATTVSANADSIYTVKSGDTLSGISCQLTRSPPTTTSLTRT